jgi:hypothetical protein
MRSGRIMEHMISALMVQSGELRYVTFNVSKLAYSLIPDRFLDKSMIFATQGDMRTHSCEVE